MKQIYIILCVLLCSMNAAAQNDRDYIRRGNRLAKDTLFSKAQVQYQKAIEFDNTNPQAHYNLGNALLYQNKPEDAMKEYDSAVKFERNKERKAKMYHNMGVVLQGAKQFDKALACYQNALRNDPTNDQTRYNYALCLYQLKNNQGGSDNQDQEQNENGEDEKKEQDKQEQQKQEQQNEQQEEQKPKPDQMSKENAEQMLKAAMQDEKATQDKIQRAQQQPNQKRLQKQW
ncbi:MAG: tetratricopeptide repeat protein [Bacteroidaceae bacterium]|nr:tetratricopeptide repeat protein [Bacteroidaceae bacterium]